MMTFSEKKRSNLSCRILSFFVVFSFMLSLIVPLTPGYAKVTSLTLLGLPEPGARVSLTSEFNPVIIRGITIHPENPLEFDFIVADGDKKLEGQAFREASRKLINYFLAALTVPEEKMWVNLSPYQKDKIIPRAFGDTEMGRDLLAQDYMLKQLTASMMYPEEELGKEFWARVYKKAQRKFGTINIPITTFVKVWIVPDEAVVYERGRSAFVIKSHLKVMLEEDYLAFAKNLGLPKHGLDRISQDKAQAASGISSEVVREFLISEIEKEVNTGKTFANLRQMYTSLILATWFKEHLERSLLGQVYVDKDKTKGVDTKDKQINQKIYNQYVKAFKKGVFDYIKKDYDAVSRKFLRKRYFSGGTDFSKTASIRKDVVSITSSQAEALSGEHRVVKVNLAEIPQGVEVSDVERAVQMPVEMPKLVVSAVPSVPSMFEAEDQYRKPIIGGNLKREFTKDKIIQLLLEIAKELQGNSVDSTKVDVFIAPEELHIERFAAVLSALESEGAIPQGLIHLGAQNVAHRDELGAFTGQHATAQQLKEYGVKYVIVGHSEVRRGEQEDKKSVRWRESNRLINKKIHTLLHAGLTPVVAFGESAGERTQGKEFDVVREQVLESLAGVTAEQVLSSNLVLAYEPVWAINTGKSATKEEANTMHKFIRNNIIRSAYGDEVAAKIRIIYGGSVKPENITALIQERNIDGGLIGGAAKKGETFVPLIKKASQMRPNKSRTSGRVLYDALVAQEAQTGKVTITMCTNIRTPLSLDGIMQAARETGSVAIFQQAMSELGYTWPTGYSPENAYRFADEARKAAERNSFYDYVLKGDHVTVKVDKDFLKNASAQEQIVNLLERVLEKKTNTEREDEFLKAFNNKIFMSNPNVANAMKAIKKAIDLVKAEVGAGMTVYALDASFMPMRLNILATAFLAGFIPEDASIETEVGEIGGEDNSTVADALELVTGIRYKETVERDPETKAIVYSELVKENGKPVVESEGKGLLDYGVKIDRIALNNGTAHGNNYDKDGNLIQTAMNLKMTAAIAEALAPYGIKIVQHGVTGTPLENLPALRAAGITSAHVGTNWQNIAWETLNEIAKKDQKVKDLVDRMIDGLIEKYGEKYNVKQRQPSLVGRIFGDAANQKNLQKLIGKELKNLLGQYKEEWLALPDSVKAEITIATKKSAVGHFKAFASEGIAKIANKHAVTVRVAGRGRTPVSETSLAAASSAASEHQGKFMESLRRRGGNLEHWFKERGKWRKREIGEAAAETDVPVVVFSSIEHLGQQAMLEKYFTDLERNFGDSKGGARNEYKARYSVPGLEMGVVLSRALSPSGNYQKDLEALLEDYERSNNVLGFVSISSHKLSPEAWLATASSAVATPERVGGINLNPALLNLQIKRDPNGVPLPVYEQPIYTMKISGFIPIIIQVTPFNLPKNLGLDNRPEAKLPQPRQRRFAVR